MTINGSDKSPKEWWSGLNKYQQSAVAALGCLEIVLTTATIRDLARRPSTQVRGPKALWWLASAVQPVGPMAYLAFGRSREQN
ncbi:MAG: PLDc_N domain-containing protein [Kineosporiaceae bacterium]|nr:PLDc_N domain-containing protein [Aeromicrobium sp.]